MLLLISVSCWLSDKVAAAFVAWVDSTDDCRLAIEDKEEEVEMTLCRRELVLLDPPEFEGG